ncbi:MAG: PEGA domain-containing protein, partial [Pseudomonadota bacterium]
MIVSLLGATIAPLAHAQAADPKASPAPGTAAPSAPAPTSTATSGTTPTPAPPPPETAPPPPQPTKKMRDEARRAYAEGEKAFAAGNYAAAYDAFQKANATIRSAHAEYWMARSLDAQNLTREAIAAYQTFLSNPDAANVGEDRVAETKARVEALELSLVAVVEIVSQPAGATVSIDGTPQEGTTPLTVKLEPGAHTIRLELAGHEPKDIQVDAQAGTK